MKIICFTQRNVSGSLVTAMLVGLYHGYQDRKKQNLENFFFGNKEMSPVSLLKVIYFFSPSKNNYKKC